MKSSFRIFFTLLSFLTLSAFSLLPADSSKNKNAGFVLDLDAASNASGVVPTIQKIEEKSKAGSNKLGMLDNLEYGELLRLNKQYAESNAAYLKADEELRKWEQTSIANPQKLFSNLAAGLFSESVKTYEGQDYEKVWLTTRLALNRIAIGDFENARVDIKRTHEREALIAEFRSKEIATAEQEAKTKGVEVKNKEINGYPVETLNDPEVLKLKNGYQNALSHYLAGFLYESLNEPGLAAPGYRKAIELKPDTKILEEGLNGLDKRTSFTQKRRQKMTDVLFVVEAGLAPQRKPLEFSVPIPTKNGTVNQSKLSYPVIDASLNPLMTAFSIDGAQATLDDVVDTNVMARRALKDEMPGVMMRNMTRLIAKEVAKGALDEATGGLGSLFDSIITGGAAPKVDDRMWHMLPERVYIARVYLKPGEHTMTINETGKTINFNVDGQYAVVPLRLMNDGLVHGSVGTIGKLE